MTNLRNDLLSFDQLSAELGVTRRTIEQWHALREGPPRIKLGGRVYYRIEAVRQWILSREQNQPRASKSLSEKGRANG